MDKAITNAIERIIKSADIKDCKNGEAMVSLQSLKNLRDVYYQGKRSFIVSTCKTASFCARGSSYKAAHPKKSGSAFQKDWDRVCGDLNLQQPTAWSDVNHIIEGMTRLGWTISKVSAENPGSAKPAKPVEVYY